MKSETLSIFTFLISLLCYGFIGFLWLLYDVRFSSYPVYNVEFSSPALFASKVQTVAFASIVGAIMTALGSFLLGEETGLPLGTLPVCEECLRRPDLGSLTQTSLNTL